jgi:very-short-patch-repair endonuclease
VRRLRREATYVERRLWYALQQNRFPWKFRRQHPIGRRIADFACPACKLAIELDVGQHADSRDDDPRSAELARHGYRVIRFWNTDVIENLEGVLEMIRQALEVPPPHPTSPPPRAERS